MCSSQSTDPLASLADARLPGAAHEPVFEVFGYPVLQSIVAEAVARCDAAERVNPQVNVVRGLVYERELAVLTAQQRQAQNDQICSAVQMGEKLGLGKVVSALAAASRAVGVRHGDRRDRQHLHDVARSRALAPRALIGPLSEPSRHKGAGHVRGTSCTVSNQGSGAAPDRAFGTSWCAFALDAPTKASVAEVLTELGRVRLTTSCRDTDSIPKVDAAGEVVSTPRALYRSCTTAC